MKTYLAMDIGGSKYMVALIAEDGQILCRRQGNWRILNEKYVLSQLLDEARLLLDDSKVRPASCGITIPGLADTKKGLWVEATFSGIREFAICKEVGAALHLPSYCDNDGQAYALAEMVFGCCRDVSDFLFINVSNGIGGAIVSGGKLLTGWRGFAGEFGHCNVVPLGRMCKCGQRGCLEMYAAGPAISHTYAENGGAPDENGQIADCKTIAARSRAGDAIATAAFKEAGRYIGRVLATAVNLLNPRRIVVGGGVSLAYDLFASSLRQSLQGRIYAYANRDIEILPTPLGYDAGLYGAAAIALTKDRQIESGEKES